MDVLLGDVARFVSRAELAEHHVVSFSFGDQEALYLRGQFTLHQNHPRVNTIWTGCEHLSTGVEHELAQKVAWVRRNEQAGRAQYPKRVLSAEGCYSHRLLLRSGIRVKLAAQKQASGLEVQRAAHASVFVINGALWLCDEAAQTADAAQGTGRRPPDLAALAAASAPTCDHTLPEVQPPAGVESPVTVDGTACGAWMQSSYRLCAEALKGRTPPTVVRHDGGFFAQDFRRAPGLTADGGRCRQAALLHLQEWPKRPFTIDADAAHDTFRIDSAGIHRVALPA